MANIITKLCLRDGGCAEVCPVECIIPGKPLDKWPWYYIDPDSCIECSACVPECPNGAIFAEDEVPAEYKAKGGEVVSMPTGTSGYDKLYDGKSCNGEPVHLDSTRVLEPGEVIDLTPDINTNREFFESGPGYEAME